MFLNDNIVCLCNIYLLFPNTGWDSDLSSIILLLHLIPPSAQGRRRPGKVSAAQAEKHLVVFKKVCVIMWIISTNSSNRLGLF